MSSQRKILSSRANGAKNRGAKTPEAQRRSAANNLKHGLLAQTLVLEDENLQAFTDLLKAHQRKLHPKDEIERDLVENIAACRWRLRCLWAIERSTLQTEMDKHEPDPQHPCTRAASAFQTLAGESSSLHVLSRYETRFSRQFAQSLTLLLKIQAGHASVLSSGNPNPFCRSEPCAIGLPACRPTPLSPGPPSVSESDVTFARDRR
jgi:hypothetical protein